MVKTYNDQHLLEEKIEQDLERVEKVEREIEKKEKQIIGAENQILSVLKDHPIKTLARDGLKIRELRFIRKILLFKFTKHKFIFALVVGIGAILVWRGIWTWADEMPLLSSWYSSLLVGLGILWLVNKYTDI